MVWLIGSDINVSHPLNFCVVPDLGFPQDNHATILNLYEQQNKTKIRSKPSDVATFCQKAQQERRWPGHRSGFA
jgi:hypothetical protein